MTNVSPSASRWQPSLVFLAFSAIAAAFAASAAFTSLHLGRERSVFSTTFQPGFLA